MRVFHLAADVGPSANGARLARIVPALQANGIEQIISVLRAREPFGASIMEAGVAVNPLPLRRFVDFAGWRSLRRAVAQFNPDVVHCWGRRAAEAINVARNLKVLSTFDGPGSFLANRVAKRLILPPIVANRTLPDRAEARKSLALSDDARVIVMVDRFENAEAAKLAVWALDLLKYSSPQWRLLIIGDGPARSRAEEFTAKLARDDCRVRFLGIVPDILPILAAADLIWQARSRGGVHFTLETLSAGVPILAVPNADLAPILNDTNSIAATDAVSIARRTMQLFDDLTMRQHLIDAGKLTAARFPVDSAITILLRSYRDS